MDPIPIHASKKEIRIINKQIADLYAVFIQVQPIFIYLEKSSYKITKRLI